jgi:hypothetical protein
MIEPKKGKLSDFLCYVEKLTPNLTPFHVFWIGNHYVWLTLSQSICRHHF